MVTISLHHHSNLLKVIVFGIIIGLLGIFAETCQFCLPLKERVGLPILFSLRGTLSPPPETVLVTIDHQSAKQLNLPLKIDQWPRTLHARVVNRLRAEGAALIVFDLLFSTRQAPAKDSQFARAIRSARNVVLAQALTIERIPMTDAQGRLSGSLHIEKLARSTPSLANAAMVQAPFLLPKIPIYLTQYWTFKTNSGDLPTLPVVVFHVYARKAYKEFIRLLLRVNPACSSILPPATDTPFTPDQMLDLVDSLRTIFKQQPNLARQMRNELDENKTTYLSHFTRQQIKSFIALYEPSASHYLNFYGPASTLRTIPYYRLVEKQPARLAGQTNLNLKDKVVFIGVTQSHSWPQINDGFYTVYSQADGTQISGVELAASAFGNLVQNRTIRLPEWPLEMGIMTICGIAVTLISCRLHALAAAAVLSALGGGYLWGTTALFSTKAIWLPVAVPFIIQLPSAYLGALAIKYRRLVAERRNIRLAFGHFLPKSVVDKLTQDINYLHDGGQILYGICLLTDAEKYTCLSESMDPESLTRLMNRYYQAVFEPIKSNDGLILQVVGDSVLAIWTAPHLNAALKTKACRAALGIDAAVRQFNAEAAEFRLPTRVGMHAGYIMLGNIGAMDHFEYRPVGDIVNTASRLEGLNKYLGTHLLISEAIQEHLKGLCTRCVGKFVFVGKSKPNLVYELVGTDALIDERQAEAHRHFSTALDAFHRQAWDEARQNFYLTQRLIGPDPPSNFYLKLCDSYSQCSPDADWDGTIYMKQK